MSVKFSINHITLLAKSTLNILSDMCAICRENVCDSCIKCNEIKNSECVSVIGICGHAFHNCCIQNYTNGLATASQKCPLCSQKWELKKRNINQSKKISTQSNLKNIQKNIDNDETNSSDEEIEDNNI